MNCCVLSTDVVVGGHLLPVCMNYSHMLLVLRTLIATPQQ